MKKIKFLYLLLAGTVLLGSCKKRLDALLVNPNTPSPSSADVDLYLNEVQLDFNSFFQQVSDAAAGLARLQNINTSNVYQNMYSPASFDGIWTTAYTGVFKNANALIPIAEDQKKYMHAGIARLMKAYTAATLVDVFGDVPFSEANLGSDNTNPNAQPGAQVYQSALSLLDSAIADFGKTSVKKPLTDLYYSGSNANWTKLAKTLKLKFLMQTRLVDQSATAKIQALITENDLINTAAQDFTFKYGTNISSPDSRHPHFASAYTAGNGGGEYLSNYFMWVVLAQKNGGNVTLGGNNNPNYDPRSRYYFYRETTSSSYPWANSQSLPCFSRSIFGSSPNPPAWYPAVPEQTPFCVVGRGYFGRDHGDNSGAPPDGPYRTEWGIYPAGGQFDADQGVQVNIDQGAKGRGISPIWLSAFTYFLEAEAVQTLGITANGTAAALLSKGVDASIQKVVGYPAAVGYSVPASFEPTSTQITNYETTVNNLYTNAATADDKLNVIMNEYYIALWGNGIEAFNNLRRTGKPKGIQLVSTVQSPGVFSRSFYYPSVYVDRNINAPNQKNLGTAANKVFWDNNPDNFIP